ncbi:MAG: hypothetical protein ACR2FF_01860 [Mycobacteriales bacterium]|nr:MAG: hypothetical protein DLM56_02415 [Pseudonocardiales bacterium]
MALTASALAAGFATTSAGSAAATASVPTSVAADTRAPVSACSGMRCPVNGGGGSGDGTIYARVITVTVTGGTGHGGSGGAGGGSTVVAPSCGYFEFDTGTQMKAYLKQIEKSGWTAYQNAVPGPAEIAKHAKDGTGHWFYAGCTQSPDGLPESLQEQWVNTTGAYIRAHWNTDFWRFAEPGQEPRPAQPPDMLSILAYQAATKNIPQPVAHAAPVGQTLTDLPTWAWLDQGDTNAVEATATDGVTTVVVTATMNSLSIRGPGSATVNAACTGGGHPYSAGGSTDCSITFHQVTPAASFTVATDWGITVTGGQLEGTPAIKRVSAPVILAVAQTQAVATGS